MIVDATDTIVGRLATRVAKAAMLGEQIDIVNCEKAVYSGSEKVVLAKFKQSVERTVPLKGPYFPRQSDKIVKRVIRGMLPYKTPKGRQAFENVKCHVGIPKDLEGKPTIQFKEGSKEKLPNVKYVTVQRISQFLGGSR